jgi:hypothetical protein
VAAVQAIDDDHAAPLLPEEASSTGIDDGECELQNLEDLHSKINPMVEESILPSLASPINRPGALTPALLSTAAYAFYLVCANFAIASSGHHGVIGQLAPTWRSPR